MDLTESIYEDHVYVVEGPLDSLFDNSFRSCCADLNLLNLEPTTTTVIYDNEPRRTRTVERMYKSTIEIIMLLWLR